MKPSTRAIYAVVLHNMCGAYAARQYAIKHDVLPLYRLARQLSAAQRAGVI